MDPNAKTIISFALFFLYLSFSNISLARGAEVGTFIYFCKIMFTLVSKLNTYIYIWCYFGNRRWNSIYVRAESRERTRGMGKNKPSLENLQHRKIPSPIDLTNARVSIIRDEAWRRQYKPAPAVIVNRGHDVMVHLFSCKLSLHYAYAWWYNSNSNQ